LTSTTSASKPVDPRGIDVFDFDVIEESWNNYVLEDGTEIHARIVLMRVARPKQGFKPGQYDLQFSLVSSVTALPEKRNDPGIPLTPEEILVKPEDITDGTKIPTKPMSTSEQWNVYRVRKTGDMFRTKMLVSEVYLVKDRFDQNGEPQYVLNWTPVVGPVAKGYEKVDLRGKAKAPK